MQKLPSVVLFLGFTILLASIVIGWMVVPKVINKKISQQVQLVNGSETFQRWQNVQLPIYVKFHLFNITNPAEVLKGAYPKFQEVGPYVYLQKRRKVDVTFNMENDTVSYRQLMSYIYQPEMSAGSLNDSITMINVPVLGMAHKASKANILERSVIVEYIQSEPAFVTKTAEELLFKGYHVDMMERFSSFLGRVLLPNNTFGFQYGKNNTDQGVYEVYTGVEDGDKFGIIASWNGSPEMPWWEDDKCKKIQGTDGSIFPPFVTTDRKLEMFSSDLCRTLRLLYEKNSAVKGIHTYRFTVDPEILEDPVFNRDNMCYCTQPGTKFANCPKTGAYQLNACRKDTPLLVSLPHFLDGSEVYLNKTEGLSPDRSIHETFVELEPNTGLLLKAAKRIQINIELKPFRFNKQLRKLPTMLLPLLWVDESVEIPEAGAERLQGKLLRPKSMAQIGTWAGVFLGLLIIAAAALIYLVRARRKKYST